jgi:hypothetical protein
VIIYAALCDLEVAMTKKSILAILMAICCAVPAPIFSQSFEKAVNETLNQLLTIGLVAGGTYLAWMFWDTSSREEQVKIDRLYLRNIKTKLINVPIGSWYEDNSIGAVDPMRNRYWIHWRIQDDPLSRENSWRTAKDLKDAGHQIVIDQLRADLNAGHISCHGYGLNDRERINLARVNNGLPLVYYDIATELQALKIHMTKFLYDIVKFTKPEHLRAGGLEGHIKVSAQGLNQGLSRSVTYLNECSQDELDQIGTVYAQRLAVDTESWWYAQELTNCKHAIIYYWKLLTRYVRLYTLQQLLKSYVTVGQRREPVRSLFMSSTMVPPYSFVRKNRSIQTDIPTTRINNTTNTTSNINHTIRI